MQKNIYLVRHSKATGQEQNAPLTDEGVYQSNQLVEFFSGKKIDRVISSPFLRAIKTIEPLAVSLGLPIEKEPLLSERVLSNQHLNDWMVKLEQTFSDLNLILDGGESSQQAMDRGVKVIDELLQGEQENCVVVTHGNLMALILKYYDSKFGFEDWKKLSNPDVFLLKFHREKVEMKRLWEE